MEKQAITEAIRKYHGNLTKAALETDYAPTLALGYVMLYISTQTHF